MYQGHQRMCCTIGVPERERRVVGEVALMHLTISTTILSVDIREDRRSGHGMEHCSIEDATHGSIGCFYPHLSQGLVPGSIGFRHHLLEVPCRNLYLQVLLGIGDAHCRESHLDEKGLSCIRDLHQPSAAV